MRVNGKFNNVALIAFFRKTEMHIQYAICQKKFEMNTASKNN